ncbi:cation transporter [Chlorogloeopsis sp. ULAP01]|uniref:cation transporter n=1 Tax=Chlorogloeopsis sp. ULAP01 TaxID=3056483 RepID=UPI0025AA8243|nr:cation transporter [Chlorogloeopsis sp. ULAP01]MDM9381997.1 cation transporter [Chlorogloeopsis sp. ULAP01]
MGDDCCQKKACELEKLRKQQSKVLWIVLLINSVMFVVEMLAGIKSASLSLTGDSLDMLGDALVYGSSLYVINKGRKAQAKSALLKGAIMFLSAVAVFARASYQLFAGSTPEVRVMSAVGFIALLANLLCLFLLTKHRNDNINLSSVWLCSRNDIIANTSVLGAAGLVFLTGSLLPDLIVGLLLTIVFAKSSGKVLSQSWRELQQA